MRVAIATVQVPFISGGGEALAAGLLEACRAAGHESEIVTAPFRFSPESAVLRSMENWEHEDFNEFNGYSPDVVICLKFPAYYLQHSRKITWLLHQHRAVYDLWDSQSEARPEIVAMRDRIRERDSFHLSQVIARYTISANVSERLRRFNALSSIPLHHPPPLAGRLYTAEPEPYIFLPSRLESLKRQELLIRAMAMVKSPVAAILSGTGGQEHNYRQLIEALGLADRVRLVGRLSENELLACYACCLAVFFAPRDEDYGYVALEAMLARKPVITCTDSGGPLEFITADETGIVTEPEPAAVAAAIDRLYDDRRLATRLGDAGYESYCGRNLSWQHVVDTLLHSAGAAR